jgi:hypothetical protein
MGMSFGYGPAADKKETIAETAIRFSTNETKPRIG